MLISLREKYGKRTLIISGITLILVILALIVALYFIFRDKEETTPVVPETALYLDTPATTTTVVSGNTTTPGSSVVTTPNTVTSKDGASIVGSSATRYYRNDSLRFSVDIPGNWSAKHIGQEVFFRSPENTRYSVQVYSANGGDMNLLRSTLSAQPNMRGITNTKFAGYDAVYFQLDGQYGYGYSFIHNGKLYYFLGRGIETSPIGQTFKII